MKQHVFAPLRFGNLADLIRESPHERPAGEWPKLSIVTPSYNQGSFLERTIRSVLDQAYPNLELIVIDGGSTDNTLEIIRRYERHITYWVSEKDSGQSDALNKGFKRATGEFVGWQNSDDVYLPGSFFEAVDALRQNPEIDVAFANRLDVDEDDRITAECRFTPFSRIGYWYEGMSMSNQSAFWRRSVFERVGYFDVDLHAAMDYEFFLRCAFNGIRFRHFRRYWGAIRRHRASKGSVLWPVALKGDCDLIDARYGRKKVLNVPLRIYSTLRRVIYYTLRGDFDYLTHGIIRRSAAAIHPPLSPAARERSVQ
ncbi:MAG TPA: glycosyltransferase family 2 protein [Nitrospiraceae bacterium]|nr:glycosyltransferase family 2 protein [Nitrospiraceae bacterium]